MWSPTELGTLPRLFVLMLATVIAACGFELRGSGGLPNEFAQTYVTGVDRRSVLARELDLGLVSGGAELVDSEEEATAVLQIDEVEFKRREISVAIDATVLEFELSLEVAFEARGRGNTFGIGRQSVIAQRVLRFEPASVLSKLNEETRLREAMEREVAQDILDRIRVADAQP